MISIKNYSHYSLCQAISHPDKLARTAKEKGYTHLALTDYNSISGAIEFIKNCKSQKINWIIGTTLSIADTNGSLVLLAKNLDGWKSLIKVISEANKKENYKEHPRLSLDKLEQLKTSGLICVVGGVDSILNLPLFKQEKFTDIYDAKDESQAKELTNPNWVDGCIELIGRLRSIFGNDGVYFESILESIPADTLCNKAVRYLGGLLKVKVLATNPSHYCNKDDYRDHHILLCSGMKTTLRGSREKLEQVNNKRLKKFFSSQNYDLTSDWSWAPQKELDNLEDFVKQFEQYNVFSNPRLPKFTCPDNKTSEEYARELCEIGWEKRKPYALLSKEDEYHTRLNNELKAYSEIGIIDYFLIVWDFLRAAKERGELTGIGRGSAGGCMLAYLLEITELDPVRYNLSSDRFYNAGRNTKDKISLPDIDTDLMISKREDSIQYMKDKYGVDRIGQVVTFGRLMGRGALKEVLRINDACTFDLINKITEHVPDEAKIADELQEMEDRGEEPSIILWALQNSSKKLKTWCYLDENGKCQGEYAKLFEQAIRLEGTLKSQGKHAAAIILGYEPLANLCPMLYNKSGDPTCGFEYPGLEDIGLPKFDFLGVAVLDKLHTIVKMIKGRYNG